MTPAIGDVYRNVEDPKYHMRITDIRGTGYFICGTEVERKIVVWDGIYGSGYETPLDRFEEFMGQDGEYWIKEN